MNVLVLHDAVPDGAPPDQQDALVQAEWAAGVLRDLGHRVAVMGCSLDLRALREALVEHPPDCVFNLVESLEGQGRLIAHVPGLLEALGVPCTGSSADALYLSSNKLLAKRMLAADGLPVLPTVAAFPDAGRRQGAAQAGSTDQTGPAWGDLWVVKSVWEHASIGLDEASLVRGAPPSAATLALCAEALGGACFAEPFVAGREFNLALLAGEDGTPEVLPPAEIDFSAFPPGKPRLVGYRAKWDADSFEYANTPRRFAFSHEDRALLAALSSLARRACQSLGVRGYARVDFRVDASGKPWILEVNANPCLSPDAGFAAAAAQAGIGPREVVARILGCALRRSGA